MRLPAVLSLALCAQPAVITVSALVIDGLDFSRTAFAKTDANGRTENRLAFRKPGYQTVITAPEPQMKVVMKTPPVTSIPRCTEPPAEEWTPLFRLPP